MKNIKNIVCSLLGLVALPLILLYVVRIILIWAFDSIGEKVFKKRNKK